MYSIYEVAQWFLQKEPMTHKKLQKLCYYAYAWYYTLKNELLCEDTRFEAWVHGPVSPEIFSKYKGNGWVDLVPSEPAPVIDESTTEMLESVWATYGSLSGNSLEALTHTETPWILARTGLPSDTACNRPISEQSMKEYYLSIFSGGEE